MVRYTYADLAKIVGVSVQMLHVYRRQGKLIPYRTFGGQAYFTDDHVIQIQNSRKGGN